MDHSHGPPVLDKSADSSTEHFLVYGYKVVPCSKRYRHDWSVCPFAHTGEMAARRDPSRYIPIFCFHSKQRLPCPRGDECPYSHNLFEYWLHPKRYRTEMCQFGAACTRPVCFFAHGEHQLRQTDMPGGPQPVVAPPEPVPALDGGYGSRDLGSPIDPAIKQQQQLMALQAAAAGFSQQQQHHHHQQQQQAAAVAAAVAAVGSIPAGMDALGAAGLPHAGSYPAMVDTSGHLGAAMHGLAGAIGAGGLGLGMSSLPGPLGLTASSPLSAPLPQLSADMLAALQTMGSTPAGSVSPMGSTPHSLLHQHSAMAGTYQPDGQLPGGANRLQRSLTAHPAVNAAAAAAAAAGADSSAANLQELTKQLAYMQLMQGGGGGAAAAAADGGLNGHSVDHLLNLAQLQQQQQQQQQAANAAAAAAAVTAGLDLSRLLPVSSNSYHATTDGSLSCPLPPVYGNGPLSGGHTGLQPLAAHGSSSVLAAASCTLPRVPTAPGGNFISSPASPQGSDAASRDALSPVGADGRDTQVPAPGRKSHRWSAPASPSNSSKGGNDLAPSPDDLKALMAAQQQQQQQPSSSASSTAGGSNNRLPSIASDQLASGCSGGLPPADISFSSGIGGAGPGLLSAAGRAGSGSSIDTAHAALLMVGDSPLEAAQVQAALSGAVDVTKGGAVDQAHGMGKEKAAQLLAQLPEDAVQKLLALVQTGGSAAAHHA